MLILGAGIAGNTLAFLLKELPYKVAQLERLEQIKPIKFGESLPPTAIAMLRRLSIEPIIKANPLHYKILGYQSAWGTPRVKDYLFRGYPVNYGWKIDKKALVNDLEKANTSVDRLLLQQKDRIEIRPQGIDIVSSDNRVKSLKCRIIIDATGRNRVLARQLGITTIHHDHLISYTYNLPIISSVPFQGATLTEAFKNGWGLLSKLDSEQIAFSLFSIKNQAIPSPQKSPDFWKENLSSTHFLKHYYSTKIKASMKGKAANSAMLASTSGENWMAIGDAAMAFDPLCSHGITTAIYTGSLAKDFIIKKLVSNHSFLDYHQNLKLIFDGYLRQRKHFYQAEQRWKDAPFWAINQV